MAVDQFANDAPTLDGPSSSFQYVTGPIVLPTRTRSVEVLTSGNLAVVNPTTGATVGPFPVVAGMALPIRTEEIAAGTTATLFVMY